MTKDCVLVINCGSSSLKFSLIMPQSGQTILTGLAERLLSSEASITIKLDGNKETTALVEPYDHQTALSQLVSFLYQHKCEQRLLAIGHRVVHGGEQYSKPELISDVVERTIEALAALAPLHNPVNLVGIRASRQAFSHLPQVAVFDTAFHQTMDKVAYLYGLPFELYSQHSIRRYGFHGTSHYFVAKRFAELTDSPVDDINVITAHLGNGCSVAAIAGGKCVDTSMGLTPLEGLVMGTRSGSLDPGIIFHLYKQLGYSIEQIDNLLNKESGLLGISQLSNDCRTLEQAIAEQGNEQADLAMDIFCYQISKTIASYSASLSNLDGIVFTGGIGENSSLVRQRVVNRLKLLGFAIDDSANTDTRFGKCGNIAKSSHRDCWVIPTNEEWVIAEQTYQLISEDN
ncbi:acetate kinase [Thalassotalea mangrovi]|uniref:Acetate kinase n=1 Tax=Thalassotalea mangrovi TaxID=2572245 RepID=A0A4V5NTZ4_9GAMM|nr:acetate kinase [Thalassotalea mangrovi]TKB43768.1 acetate kinase [Thalassotalea mangrovi]